MSISLRKNSHKSTWKILLLILLVSVGGLLTAWFVAKQTAKNSLLKLRQELTAKGIPVDDESLVSLHRSQCSDENSSQWMNALDAIGEKELKQKFDRLVIAQDRGRYCQASNSWPEQPMVEQQLVQHAEIIERLLELAQDNRPVYMPIRFQSLDTLFRYAQFAGDAADVLVVEAIIAARNLEPEREFRAINAMLGCSIAISGELGMRSQYNTLQIHKKAIQQIQNAIKWNRLNAEQIELLKQRLAISWDIKQILSLGFQGEVGMMIPPKRGQVMSQYFSAPMIPVLEHAGIVDRAAVKYATSIEKALELDFTDRKQLVKQVAEIQLAMFEEKPPFDLDQLFYRSLSPTTSAVIQEQMFCDLAVIAISIRQFEHKRGRLPDSLSDLESLGVDLQQYKSVDGSTPLYRLLEPVEQSVSRCRAVLWSFDFEKEDAISPKPPEPQAAEAMPLWWSWEIK